MQAVVITGRSGSLATDHVQTSVVVDVEHSICLYIVFRLCQRHRLVASARRAVYWCNGSNFEQKPRENPREICDVVKVDAIINDIRQWTTVRVTQLLWYI